MNGKTGKIPKSEKKFETRIEPLRIVSAEVVRRKKNDLDSYSNYLRLRFEGNLDVKLKIEERYPIPSDSKIDMILAMHNIGKSDNDMLDQLVGKQVEALIASSNKWKSAIVVGFLN